GPRHPLLPQVRVPGRADVRAVLQGDRRGRGGRFTLPAGGGGGAEGAGGGRTVVDTAVSRNPIQQPGGVLARVREAVGLDPWLQLGRRGRRRVQLWPAK